jgi:hypothetical protein
MPATRFAKRSLPLLVPVLLALAVVAVNGPVGAIDGGNACSPFQTTIVGDPGPTSLQAHGSTRFAHANSSQGDLGGGVLTWKVEAIITGANTNSGNGALSGFLNFTIDWDSHPDSSFQSECVSLVRTTVGFLNGAQYEGYVEGFFPQALFGQEALALLHLERVRPRVANLDLSVQAGDICETGPQFFHIHKDNSFAPGHKTENGGREAHCPPLSTSG